MNKYIKVILDRKYRFKVLVKLGFFKSMSDEKFLKKIFKNEMNKELNLDNPCTFNEKLQWLKLYDRKPEYTDFVDKFKVKDIIISLLGEEYVIPTYGMWERFEDIDFNKLPNQFVLKCTHDSGGVVVCRDKNNFDIKKARKVIVSSLKRNFYSLTREWPYKNIKPRIIAEKYLEDSSVGELIDYKFFCFNGKVKSLFIATERQSINSETKFDFYDTEFNHLNIINGHPNAIISPKKPKNFDKMIKFAEKLSAELPHIRVDFYEVDGRLFFGEMTFYHWSGLVPFEPESWDFIWGDWLELPEVRK